MVRYYITVTNWRLFFVHFRTWIFKMYLDTEINLVTLLSYARFYFGRVVRASLNCLMRELFRLHCCCLFCYLYRFYSDQRIIWCDSDLDGGTLREGRIFNLESNWYIMYWQVNCSSILVEGIVKMKQSIVVRVRRCKWDISLIITKVY